MTTNTTIDGSALVDAQRRLAGIAARVTPCGPPNVMEGMDSCPCGVGGTWPCPITEAAWLARGVDRDDEVRRVMDRLRAEYLSDLATIQADHGGGEDR
jgi:hypothetical protein